VGPMFWNVVDMLGARRVVIVAGADSWADVRQRLGLERLEHLSKPILAAGRSRNVAIVATYHPGARMKGVTRDSFASQVADQLRNIESN